MTEKMIIKWNLFDLHDLINNQANLEYVTSLRWENIVSNVTIH